MRNHWFAGLLGLGTCALLLGCGAKPADSGGDQGGATPAAHDHAADHGHDHAAEGPHGGHLIVLGEEEYHAELTHDEATHTVAVYLLDSSGKEPVSSEQEALTLQVFEGGDFVDYAIKATGDDGAFSTTDEKLCDLLLHAEVVKGRIHATIGGKEYVGTIEHAAHAHDHAGPAEHEGHDHADHDHETGHADEAEHSHGDSEPHSHDAPK